MVGAPLYFRLDLIVEREIASVWLSHREDWLERLANGVIVVGNGLLPEEGTVCNSWVTASGSYNCDSPVTGRYVFIWVTHRLSTKEDVEYINFYEMRPLGMPNLTQTASIQETSTPSPYSNYQATNLV